MTRNVHVRQHLTDQRVRAEAAAPQACVRRIFDAVESGLCLRVTGSGKKNWFYGYVYKGRPGGWTFGSWPALGVADARRRVREMKDQLGSGVDPKAAATTPHASLNADHASAGAEPTFGDVARRYLERKGSRLRHGPYEASVIERYLLPRWRQRPMSGLGAKDAAAITSRLETLGSPGIAELVGALVKRIGNWAEAEREIAFNPFADFRMPERRAPRLLSDDELRSIWRACVEIGYPFGPFVQILMLTGRLRGEVAEMSWSELDLAAAEWIIPPRGAAPGAGHIVPLSAPALSILRRLPRLAGPYVFTAKKGLRPFQSLSKAKRELDRLSCVGGWRYRDLRANVRARMAALGVATPVIDQALRLAPRNPWGMSSRYLYLDERRAAMRKWGRKLAAIVAAATVAKPMRKPAKRESRVGLSDTVRPL
jgi:integrase